MFKGQLGERKEYDNYFKRKMKEKKQTQAFDSESYRYISSYIKRSERRDVLIPQSIVNEPIKSMLDVGCGNGDFLNDWKKHFGLNYAVGVEPSEDGVKMLKEKWKLDNNINFQSAFAHNLPFESDSFDLVTTWSVLHWIGRNEYLQSIGEMIRVCSKYLCVMDFIAEKDYRTPYHHKDGLYTYKQDFDKVISASGIMRPLDVLLFWENDQNGEVCMLSEKDLKLFEKNSFSYYARKIVVYEKDFCYLPSKTETDFV